jgi:hypothetical protein
MTSLGLGIRTAAHAASLIFGAWWLVATSSLPGPERDCFTGIANPTRLEVTLGSPNSVAVSGSSLPSCAGIDGLAANGTLVFDLSQGPRPEDDFDCYGYDTQALSGVNGVTLQVAPKEGASALTSASGVFVSPELADCTGTWSLILYPERYPQSQPLTSPLDAGPDEPWIVQRLIRSNRPSLCGGTFAEAGVLTCGDGFSVASMRVPAAP